MVPVPWHAACQAKWQPHPPSTLTFKTSAMASSCGHRRPAPSPTLTSHRNATLNLTAAAARNKTTNYHEQPESLFKQLKCRTMSYLYICPELQQWRKLLVFIICGQNRYLIWVRHLIKYHTTNSLLLIYSISVSANTLLCIRFEEVQYKSPKTKTSVHPYLSGFKKWIKSENILLDNTINLL